MRHTLLVLAALFFASAPAWAIQRDPPKNPSKDPPPAKDAPPAKGTELRGKIVRTSPTQFVVRSEADNKEIAVRVRPQTRFLLNDKPIRGADLRVGAVINAGYVMEGEAYVADTVTVVDAVADANILEGTVVRVGVDQIVLRTPDGKEAVVFVDAQTALELADRVTRIEDLKPGAAVAVYFDLRNRRYVAKRIVGVSLLQGQVVRTVGQDQVVLLTSERKEVIVYVVPETRFVLGPRSRGIVDLRPGVNVGVFYDTRGDRFTGRSFFLPSRRLP